MPGQVSREPRRIAREKRTIELMVQLFCRAHHGTGVGLCAECADLRDYAFCRLDHCPLGNEKPACAQCPIHCYRPAMRTQAKTVMRFAGPRMLWRHPLLALLHKLSTFNL
jgi:hypothetical protein